MPWPILFKCDVAHIQIDNGKSKKTNNNFNIKSTNIEKYFFYISFIIKINKSLQFLVYKMNLVTAKTYTIYIYIQAIISNKIEVLYNFLIVVIDKFSIFFYKILVFYFNKNKNCNILFSFNIKYEIYCICENLL